MELLWHHPLGPGFFLARHRPLPHDGGMLVRYGGIVAAHDATDGTRWWASDVGRPSDDGRWFLPMADLVVTDVARAADRLARAVAVGADGSVAWSRDLPVVAATTCAVVDGSTLVVAGTTLTGSAVLSVLDGVTGAEVERSELAWAPLGLVLRGPGRLLAMSRFGAAPGLFEVAARSGRCTEVRAGDVWRLEADGVHVLVVDRAADRAHRAHVLSRDDLTEVWSAEIDSDAATLAGGAVRASADGALVTWDASDGTELDPRVPAVPELFDIAAAGPVVVATTAAGVLLLSARDGTVLQRSDGTCAPPHARVDVVHLLRGDGLMALRVDG